MTDTTTTSPVRPVTPGDAGDRAAVVAALASAFFDDPVFAWIVPDDDRRRAALPGSFEVFHDAIARHGTSHAVGDGVGAALWVPPGETVAEDEDAFGGALLSQLIDEADQGRLLAVMELLGSTHPHEACWYLNLLGVADGNQGQGIGSTMLRVAIERAEADGVPAYLEATSEANRRLYERHGFVTTADLELPGGPTLYAMWRR